MAEKALAQAAKPGNDQTSHVYVIGPDGGPFKSSFAIGGQGRQHRRTRIL